MWRWLQLETSQVKPPSLWTFIIFTADRRAFELHFKITIIFQRARIINSCRWHNVTSGIPFSQQFRKNRHSVELASLYNAFNQEIFICTYSFSVDCSSVIWESTNYEICESHVTYKHLCLYLVVVLMVPLYRIIFRKLAISVSESFVQKGYFTSRTPWPQQLQWVTPSGVATKNWYSSWITSPEPTQNSLWDSSIAAIYISRPTLWYISKGMTTQYKCKCVLLLQHKIRVLRYVSKPLPGLPCSHNDSGVPYHLCWS